jgi:LPXTG-motif cell wall-anchored protein
MLGKAMKLLRLSLSVAIMLVGFVVLAVPARAQTNPTDYTPACTEGNVQPSCQPAPTTAPPQVAAEALARTGSDSSIPLARIGVSLVALGGLAVLFARRRRHASPAPS